MAPLVVANAPADPSVSLAHLVPWQRWIQLETWRGTAHWRPWRARPDLGETEDDCDDPDRLIVHDDVAEHTLTLTYAPRAVQFHPNGGQSAQFHPNGGQSVQLHPGGGQPVRFHPNGGST